jgi:hypothetical protein
VWPGKTAAIRDSRPWVLRGGESLDDKADVWDMFVLMLYAKIEGDWPIVVLMGDGKLLGYDAELPEPTEISLV